MLVGGGVAELGGDADGVVSWALAGSASKVKTPTARTSRETPSDFMLFAPAGQLAFLNSFTPANTQLTYLIGNAAY